MPCVGFEPTIPESERAKKIYDLERSATVTDSFPFTFTFTKGYRW
jgi:hypothetical protein